MTDRAARSSIEPAEPSGEFAFDDRVPSVIARGDGGSATTTTKEDTMKITKDAKLALVDGKGQVKEVLAEGRETITDMLATRAKPNYGAGASHVTNTTRKYQCNADLRYAKAIKKLRTEHKLATDGAAIRMLLEAGLVALGFKDLVAEVEADHAEEE